MTWGIPRSFGPAKPAALTFAAFFSHQTLRMWVLGHLAWKRAADRRATASKPRILWAVAHLIACRALPYPDRRTGLRVRSPHRHGNRPLCALDRSAGCWLTQSPSVPSQDLPFQTTWDTDWPVSSTIHTATSRSSQSNFLRRHGKALLMEHASTKGGSLSHEVVQDARKQTVALSDIMNTWVDAVPPNSAS